MVWGLHSFVFACEEGIYFDYDQTAMSFALVKETKNAMSVCGVQERVKVILLAVCYHSWQEMIQSVYWVVVFWNCYLETERGWRTELC